MQIASVAEPIARPPRRAAATKTVYIEDSSEESEGAEEGSEFELSN